MPLRYEQRKYLDKQFSLAHGGGIFIDEDRVDSNQNHNYLIIGLGGLGTDALIRLKHMIHNHMTLPADRITGLPIRELPENVRFLAVDSDDMQLFRGDFFGNTRLSQTDDEIFSLKPKIGPIGVPVLQILQQAKNEGNQYVQWIHPNLTAIVHGDGAGQQRAVGRALFFHSRITLRNKLQKILNEMPYAAANTTIFLLTSIGGGTGSGAFLDMGYLLKEIAPVNTQILAYIFMPEVNFRDSINHDSEYANAYAALKELDFLLEEGNVRHKPFRQYYNEVEMPIEQLVPFDFVHLIGKQDSAGVEHSRDEILSNVAESIYTHVVRSEHDAFAFNEFYNDSIRHYLNIASTQVKYPSFPFYLSTASAVLAIPYTEIATLMTAELFRQLDREIFHNEVNTESLKQDQQALGLSTDGYSIEDHLSRQLELSSIGGREAPGYVDLSIKKYPKNTIFINADYNCTAAYRAAYKDVALYQQNAHQRQHQLLEIFHVKLKSFIEHALIDLERGPFYLYQLFGERLINVHDPTRGVLGELLRLWNCLFNRCRVEVAESEMRMREIILEGNQRSLFGRITLAKEYLNELAKWHENSIALCRYRRLQNLIQDEIYELYQKYFGYILEPLWNTLDELRHIFEDNYTLLEAKEMEAVNDPSILISPIQFKDFFSGQFDSCVASAKTLFMTDVIKNLKYWVQADLDDITYEISTINDIEQLQVKCAHTGRDLINWKLTKFISYCGNPIFDMVSMENVIAHLDCFGIGTINDSVNHALNRLLDCVNPLFCVREEDNPIEYNPAYTILSVPYDNPIICLMAEQLSHNRNNIFIKHSMETSRITVSQISSGYALYNYSELMRMEKAYTLKMRSSEQYGLHINCEWIRPEKLPSPFVEPAWPDYYVCETTKKHNDHFRTIFKKLASYSVNGKSLIHLVDIGTYAYAELLIADTLDISNLHLRGNIVNRKNALQTIVEKDLWPIGCRTLKLFPLGKYRKTDSCEESKRRYLDNICENALRDPEVCRVLQEQNDLLDRIEILQQ